MNVEKSKFRKPVFPDQVVYTEVRALRSKGRVWRLEARSYDDNNATVCEAMWSAMIMDRNND